MVCSLTVKMQKENQKKKNVIFYVNKYKYDKPLIKYFIQTTSIIDCQSSNIIIIIIIIK